MAQATPPRTAALQAIVWEELFVVIDDGMADPLAYRPLTVAAREHMGAHSAGVGCLVIIPPHAAPPSEAVRRAADEAIQAVPYRCVCYCVEGTGFPAAMVRGVLTGFHFLKRSRTPTRIAGDLPRAAEWLLPHLRPRSPDETKRAIASLLSTIASERRAPSR